MSGREISVVVPTYRRPALLRRCLSSLAAQDLDRDRFEVVVVDDGSGDETPGVVASASKQSPNIRALIQAANAGPAAARNRGVGEATAPIVLFLDDDVACAPDLLLTHLHLHEAAKDPLLGILGLVEWDPALRVTPFMRWVDRSGLQFGYATWLREGPVDPPAAAFYTANLSMGRALFLSEGGFDERFPYPAYEDMELAWRLAKRGFQLEYRPSARAYHTRAIEMSVFRERMKMVAESAVVLRAVQPEFPLDESAPLRGAVRRRERLRLRMLAPFARLIGNTSLLERHYWAEIAAGYLEGRERGERKLASQGAG